MITDGKNKEEFGETMINPRHDPHAKTCVCCRGHPVVVRLIRGLCGSSLQARLTLFFSSSLIIDAIWPACLPLAAWHHFSAIASSEASSGSAVPPSPGTEPMGCVRWTERRGVGGTEEETDQLSYYFVGSIMHFSGIYTVLNFGLRWTYSIIFI